MLKPLSPYQALSVKESRARMNLWEGSVRSSKTTCANLAWIRFLLELIKSGDPEIPCLMVGKTERTLKRNVIDPLVSMLGTKRCRFIAGRGEVIIMGQTVYVIGANDERSAERIAGLTLRGAYVDELSLIPESFFKMLMSRLSMEDARLYGTSNPDSSNHWLLKQYLKRASVNYTAKDGAIIGRSNEPLDLVRFSFRLGDNPHLPVHYVEALAAEYTGLWKLRYIDGLWVIAEGAIYPMWGDHLVNRWQRVDGGMYVTGIDYGTTNPFAAVALHITKRQISVISELYITEPLTDSELSTAYREWCVALQIRPQWVCIDPSAASFKRQLYRDRVHGVVDANNNVNDGLRMVASLMEAGKLAIDESCEHLQEEVPGYRWDPKKSDEGIDKPIKKDDHAVDALRYGISTTEPLWRGLITQVQWEAA